VILFFPQSHLLVAVAVAVLAHQEMAEQVALAAVLVQI
jgi:hypothetical protein